MTVVGSDHLEVLRALLAGDAAEFERAAARLPDGPAGGLGILVVAAFYEAAERGFAAGTSNAAIVRFIADARSSLPANADLDPALAEAIVRSAVHGDHPSAEDAGSDERARVQMMLVPLLIGEARHTEPELDVFLERARARAESFFAS